MCELVRSKGWREEVEDLSGSVCCNGDPALLPPKVIPQLIARIDHPRRLVAKLIHDLLTDVGKQHPQVCVCAGGGVSIGLCVGGSPYYPASFPTPATGF